MIDGYLVGCAGCGGMFMLDQALPRRAPLGYPPSLAYDPWFCARCTTRRAAGEATEHGDG